MENKNNQKSENNIQNLKKEKFYFKFSIPKNFQKFSKSRKNFDDWHLFKALPEVVEYQADIGKKVIVASLNEDHKMEAFTSI